MSTTKNETIRPVPKAARALSASSRGAGFSLEPLNWAMSFLKFSKIPNLADPMMPTPMRGVTVP